MAVGLFPEVSGRGPPQAPNTSLSKADTVALSDIARTVENSINKRGIVRRRAQGWQPRILPFTGYGSVTELHVMARAIMTDPNDFKPFTLPFLPKNTHGTVPKRHGADHPDNRTNTIDTVENMVEKASNTAREAQRGWRQFFTTQVGYLPVTVEIAGHTVKTRTDSSGYIDLLIHDHGLQPGWHTARIEPAVGDTVSAPVVVVEPEARVGLVSDIDDTIVVTWLPRMMLAAWNSFVLRTNTRTKVPGMAQFYAEILRDHPNAPVFYLSTGAWNTFPAMQEFIHENGLPLGPLLMTDWGPTPTGLFRSGQEHKVRQLRNLMITFPNIRWILVGDDGQHDPHIYGELAREHPQHVAGIAIRELNPVEKVLSQGALVGLDARNDKATRWPNSPHSIPHISAKDGFGLLNRLDAFRTDTVIQDPEATEA